MSGFLRKVSQVFCNSLTADSDKPCNSESDAQQARSALDDASNNNASGDMISVSPNNTSPSDIPPDNIPSPSNDIIPNNILAFRTITTMLAQIQQERLLKVLDPDPTMSKIQRRELKISNAVSNVAVTDHDIVAVVTKFSPNKLEVIACTHHSEYENPLINAQSHPSNTFSHYWDVLVTKNFRRSDPRSATPISHPIIIDATIPAGLEPGDDEGLEKYINSWSKPTLATHLWILSRLLTMKDPSGDGGPPKIITGKLSDRLLFYVITTCYPKMIRRLGSTISLSYIQSLKEVEVIPFDNFRPEKLSTEETESDRQFLVNFLLPAVSLDWFQDISVPNIHEQAKLAGKKEPFQLYTEETCQEFHQLLLKLLEQFRKSLVGLSKSRGKGDVPTESSDKLREDSLAVQLYGYALQRIARGAALRMHLKTIAPLLNYHRAHDISLSMSIPKAEMEEERVGYDKEHGEFDEELKAVQPFVTTAEGPIPLWQSYIDWLKLMVVQFDAVDILVRYVTGQDFPYDTISIQILVAPDVDDRLLPWRELFTNPKFFPTNNALDSLPTKTNEEISRFLVHDTNSDPQVFLGLAGIALNTWTDSNPNREKIIKHVEALKGSKLHGWKECVEKLLVILRDWTPGSSDVLDDDIHNTLRSLRDNAQFFHKLNIMKSFTGTLHCEACLASLFGPLAKLDSNNGTIMARVQEFGRVIGVSKRCCPTCHHLLSLLTKETDPFLVRGSHSTVTACTLPTWLPEHIVDSMNEFFGSQLRRELIGVMSRSELLRNRAPLTGSQRLSFDSTEGWGEDIDSPIPLTTFKRATLY